MVRCLLILTLAVVFVGCEPPRRPGAHTSQVAEDQTEWFESIARDSNVALLGLGRESERGPRRGETTYTLEIGGDAETAERLRTALIEGFDAYLQTVNGKILEQTTEDDGSVAVRYTLDPTVGRLSITIDPLDGNRHEVTARFVETL